MSNGATKAIYLCPMCNGISQPRADGSAVCGTCHFSYEISSQVRVLKAPEPRQAAPRKKLARGAVERDIIVRRRANDAVDFARIETVPEAEAKEVLSPDQVHREKRRRLKKRTSTLRRDLAIAGLAAVLITTAITFYFFIKDHFESRGVTEQSIEEKLTGEQRKFYFAESASISKTLLDFLASPTTDSKANYVVKGGRVPGIMGPYYMENPMKLPSGGFDESPIFWNLAYQEKPSFVEAIWQDGVSQEFEGVFLKTSEGWQLDWEQFVRYSSTSWTYFLQRFGHVSEGDFRVYASLVTDAELEDDSDILIRLHPPVSDEKQREVEASPIIPISLSSEAGVAFHNLFTDQDRFHVDGEPLLSVRDPKELRRVRVRLRWVENKERRKFEMVLDELLATNWRGDYSRFKESKESGAE